MADTIRIGILGTGWISQSGDHPLALERIFESMATDMVAVLQGRRPEYCVNPEVLP